MRNVVDLITDNEDFIATRHLPLQPPHGHFRHHIDQLPLAVCGRPTVTSPLYRPEPERGVAEQQPEQRRVETKPRIWSLADIATSGTNTSSSSSSSFDGANSCPRVPLGALWATPPSISPLISTRFQPWTGCSTTSAHQPLPSSTFFHSGLLPVGGLPHPSSPNMKIPQPSRGESASVETRSTLLLSPDSRPPVDAVGGTTGRLSRDSIPTCDDDERR